MKPIIYLSATVTEFEYRKKCIHDYSDDFVFIDPIQNTSKIALLKDDFQGIVDRSVRASDTQVIEIVEKDKNDILSSDYMVVYINTPTFGTIMEILYAHEYDIPVYGINPNGKYINDIWFRYHVQNIYESVDECYNAIKLLGYPQL